ncbi:hypothetical protein BJ684DRAFT_14406 [Piptocephalis cylindrospora]|uniref:Chitin-binding type-4 domain-containing protein n=1 Tax=Piptocephalis cylindrospora TaxID=1907219 RepID=A0A4P9Y8H5_9FUNG|nr:hypothetical protein BJ684DRAFT_14406 [Piptocephalis cylindrospora]|eukprot:RKP15335.1 hypothetical protein BJ684DRAFT_14406 [Piptocephalis cylindrospora]
MRTTLFSILGLGLLASTGYSHMYEAFPYPRGSPDNPKLSVDQKDVNIHTPATSVCRGHPAADVTYNLKAGETLNVKVKGPSSAPPSAWATHKGGHCQWGISYDDGKTVAVFHRQDNTCGVQDDGKFDTVRTDYAVPIPKDLVNSEHAVFVWSWAAAQGGPHEMFQSCVDVSISGGKDGGSYTGDNLVYRNFPGAPDLAHWNGGVDPNFGDFTKDIHPVTVSP